MQDVQEVLFLSEEEVRNERARSSKNFSKNVYTLKQILECELPRTDAMVRKLNAQQKIAISQKQAGMLEAIAGNSLAMERSQNILQLQKEEWHDACNKDTTCKRLS